MQEIKNRDNGYIDHIAFDVDDIENTFPELKNNGYYICEEQPVFFKLLAKRV